MEKRPQLRRYTGPRKTESIPPEIQLLVTEVCALQYLTMYELQVRLLRRNFHF